ncbi:ArgE/DapE family deacylase [Paraburkholderia guartelaensis]|uniref:ArgE/DapE family deacylase n=1 Tax=Paraburkholderia guartelaensis TaxID=2546446 RepID=A0A4R5L4H6_9BURK|nr:ArgE/DapE family deacylase [Paraburkholderia guartelaensis]TDG03551.1 ArgE/DapE family deacylase [Paraburkholderia guartelaensis]
MSDHEIEIRHLEGAISRAVEAGFDRQISTLAELVKIPSQRGEETAAQAYMASMYRERGFDVDEWLIDLDQNRHLPGFSPVAVSYDNCRNVVGTHRARNRSGRSLILNGHIDVVPVGPRAQWTTDPYGAEVIDGWMYGRGAGDMKSGLLACVAAIDALASVGLQPAGDVFLQSVVEEECTGNGALACLARGYKAHAAFIPEPLLPKLMRAQVGPMWFQVHVAGDPQHASAAFSGAGANAIEKAIYLIGRLQELERRWNARKVEHRHFCDHPHPIRFNLGKIAGGDWPSSVPAWCTFDMRVAVYPGQSLAAARVEIESFIAEASHDDPFLRHHAPRVEYHGFMAEGYVLTNSEDVEASLGRAHSAVFGEPLTEYATSAATDARFFGLYADTPAIVYGPECKMPHGYDEAVNLESLKQVTKTLALFVADWCGVEQR